MKRSLVGLVAVVLAAVGSVGVTAAPSAAEPLPKVWVGLSGPPSEGATEATCKVMNSSTGALFKPIPCYEVRPAHMEEDVLYDLRWSVWTPTMASATGCSAPPTCPRSSP